MYNMDLLSVMDVVANPKKKEEYDKLYNLLLSIYGDGRGIDKHLVFENFNVVRSKGSVTTTGNLKDEIELGALAVSMVCDNCYSHFGGTAFVADDGYFKVTILND